MKNILSTLLILTLILIFPALTTSQVVHAQNPYADFIRQLDTLKETKLKRTPIIRQNRMDSDGVPLKDYYVPQEAIEEYVACFDRLRLTLPDATVQCYYCHSWSGGQPYLVASTLSIDSLLNIVDISFKSILDSAAHQFMVPAEDTPMAYFQYLVFKEYGEQFALYWHAFYGVKKILLQHPDDNDENLFGKLTVTNEPLYESSRGDAILPVVRMDDKYCYITLFESNHENIRQVEYCIKRTEPWRIMSDERVMAEQPPIAY